MRLIRWPKVDLKKRAGDVVDEVPKTFPGQIGLGSRELVAVLGPASHVDVAVLKPLCRGVASLADLLEGSASVRHGVHKFLYYTVQLYVHENPPHFVDASGNVNSASDVALEGT